MDLLSKPLPIVFFCLYQVWFFLGAATGALMGGGLTDRIGYYGTMWVGAGITGLGAILSWLLLPETKPDFKVSKTDISFRRKIKLFSSIIYLYILYILLKNFNSCLFYQSTGSIFHC